LALAKTLKGVPLIVMGKAFYCLVNRALYLQFHDAFSLHLSPHQFNVVIKGGCEVVVHGIRIVLNVHIDWAMFQVHHERFQLHFT
jgi:hypothetical protein